MTFFVDRTVRRIKSNEDEYFKQEPQLLSDLDSERGYVLLGEPGMGKTTEFSKEADRVGGLLIPVRRFINRDPGNHPEWKKGPLFLDGLDEARVGGGDPRTALDKIINQLEALGKPRFRLSCRAGSWLGSGYLDELSSLSDSEVIPVLELNPLNIEDVRQIVSQGGHDATTFILQAHDHNMVAFLFNPQLLDLLLKSVEASGWPDNPSKTFENACQELVREQNREYHDARSFDPQPCRKAVLSAAGQLFALMLIANKSGWATDTYDPDILSLDEVQCQDRPLLYATFDSGLFKGSRDCRIPIHRLLAEFLAARYLHEKIQDGLNVRRVFALLMGEDGVPLPDLRGLAAWLAALNPKARQVLIQADPIAVAFNGDTSSFSPEERRKLLEYLERSIDLTYTWPSAAALGTLAGNQGMSLARELADSSIRSENRQTLVYQLLRGVSQMHAGMDRKNIPENQLAIDRENLLHIIYDPSWRADVRGQALRALNRVLTGAPDRGATLRRILDDLAENRLLDETTSLRGTVLEFLYPGELQPSEVWGYLLTGPAEHDPPAYLNFWVDLVARSNEEQIRELINSLCNQASEIIPKLANYGIEDIVLEFLARGLDLFGDKLDLPELYRWFELVEFDDHSSEFIPMHSSVNFYSGCDHEANEKIRNWLGQRKEKQYALIEHDLLTQESKINDDNTIGLKFVGKNTPAGFRSWCLARAAELWDIYPIAAERLAWWSVWMWEGWGKPLSDDKVEQIVSGTPGLSEWNRRRLSSRIQLERKEVERKKRQKKRRAAFLERRRKELEPIRQQKTELAKGRCSPVLLDQLAHIYFSGSINQDDNPRTSLESYMNGDQSLVQATLEGFRSLLNRDDLPDLEQIAEFHENNRRSYFARPFLAGIQEECETGTVLDRLNDKGIRRFLGFYLVTDIPGLYNRIGKNNANSNCPETWFKQILTDYPGAVADSLVTIHNACVRAKLLPNEYLYKMAYDQAYSRIAQLAVSRMFTVFPTRCSRDQLNSLRVVLWSVILAGSMSTENLRKIVLKRLNRKDMDIGQKAYWLCAGLSVARDHCLPLLIDFLSTGGEPRIRHVFDFLITSGSREFIFRDMSDWQPEELSSLIQALGKRGQSFVFREGPYVLGNGMRDNLSPLTPWIEELGRRSDDDAAETLALLADDPDLATWRQEIRRAREAQAWNSRAAKRQDFSIEQVQRTLRGGPPASAADLAALTTNVLEELADRIRNGQTDDWSQYWYWDRETEKPTSPRDENYCRNVLLSDLKKILCQHDIDAQPEGRYADEKRADIRVSYGADLSVPIEIKKNSHQEIWRGISEQLIPKYTRDPNSDGYGIYLVLWFGADRKYMKWLPPSGGVPNKPEELKSMLKIQLDPMLNKRIHIVVIDVSLVGKYAADENNLLKSDPGSLSSF
ncbi:MAG: hypothetical protein OXD43_03970 [Bacteroidetes bacterium]|nr:hypothetical protein [Bacteroidota bacterium]